MISPLGSGNGLEPSDRKLLPVPMMSQVDDLALPGHNDLMDASSVAFNIW